MIKNSGHERGQHMHILMHENYPVAKIQIDKETGSIVKVKDIFDIARIPVGVHIRKGILERAELNEWWESRCIPITRQNYTAHINELDVINARVLALRNNGLSLSDHYWIKNESDEYNWESINFYKNSFSGDIGDIFCMGRHIEDIDFRSPDSTSGGWLKKKWEKQEEGTYLLKGSSSPFYQEALNEAAISNAYKNIGYSHYLQYSVQKLKVKGKTELFSRCRNMTDDRTELISAYSLYKEEKKSNHVNVYEHLIEMARNHGMEIESFLKHEILMDYITNNIDRHLNNIAFLRDVKTLNYVGIAPVFDSGTSLWLDTADKFINGKEDSPAKPFAVSQKEQIKRYINKDYLEQFLETDIKQIPYAIEQVFKDNNYDVERTGRIVKAVEIRTKDILREHSYEKVAVITSENTENIFSTEEDIIRKEKYDVRIDELLEKYKEKELHSSKKPQEKQRKNRNKAHDLER